MTVVEIDPLAAALAGGCNVREALHACASSFEARALVYTLTDAELRAAVLQEAFAFKQDQLSADDYAEWSS
jgi:hypothetical protein